MHQKKFKARLERCRMDFGYCHNWGLQSLLRWITWRNVRLFRKCTKNRKTRSHWSRKMLFVEDRLQCNHSKLWLSVRAFKVCRNGENKWKREHSSMILWRSVNFLELKNFITFFIDSLIFYLFIEFISSISKKKKLN